MKGWRTILVNVGIVALTAILQWAVGFNWIEAVGEIAAMTIVALANAGLRYITTTPIGESAPVVRL